jgi:tetratricopeptide (TPR) repeat protein
MCRHAVSAFIVLLALSPSLARSQQIADEQSRRQAIEFYRAGEEFMSGEQFEKAAEAYTQAIGKDPLLTVAHYQLGQANMSLRRYTSAIQAYKGCLQAMESLHHLEESNKFEVDKQRDQEIRELRSQMDSINQQKDIGPLKRAAIEQHLQDLQQQQRTPYVGPFRPPPFVLLALGSAYFRNGDREGAEAQWRAAVEANPRLGEAHNNLAVIYLQSGKKAEAENAVKLAEKAGFRVNPQLKADIKNLPD